MHYIFKFNHLFLLIFLSLLVSGCGHVKTPKIPPRETHLTAANFSDLRQWNYDSQYDALQTFKKSCSVLMSKNTHRSVSKLTELGGRVKDWVAPCREALGNGITNNIDARAFFERWFKPYMVKDANGHHIGRFTGYYEIELHGSYTKSVKCPYPVYAPPKNLKAISGTSGILHSAINKGALRGKNLELAYVDNRARLFFMQIQGSGIINLAGGGHLKLGYAGQNGHKYTTIGPLLKHYGAKNIRSAVDIMNWLHRNPKSGLKIMENNQSYVFFKKIEGDSPIGGQGIPLTPERSIAIDSRLYPYGVPIWVETNSPQTTSLPSLEYNRLFIAQDTGGAIKGAVRGDIFYGRGRVAEELAGFMNNKGSYYILFPKSIHVPEVYHAH